MLRYAPNYKAGVSALSLSWWDGSATRSAYGTYNLGLAQWHHVAVTRAGTAAYQYVDGVSVSATPPVSFGTGSGIAANLSNAPQNYLGKNRTAGAGSDTSLDGSLDDVLISCRAYTADEIKHLAYKP